MTVTKTLTSAAVAASIISVIGFAVAQTSTDSTAPAAATTQGAAGTSSDQLPSTSYGSTSDKAPSSSTAPMPAAQGSDTSSTPSAPKMGSDSSPSSGSDAAPMVERKAKADRN